ncbi:hypothetical protein CEE37_14695 [candidate division LCP-89 bacterium B3_LCP]|uniref:Secretion system C-terminal sorting domain-containing protein n=1 Tax=candidate division LCP-89 bacterium B3_LCP TaxID=2012998 RepID=A0A532UPH4_UNCL8|nr:MAG: hypothetical protein CEE37_14695 [candidate division LCP-89 bacterium B3_LCP]
MDKRDGEYDIYGQRFDAQGNRLWGDTGLPLAVYPEDDDIGANDVCMDSLDNGFVSWVTPGSAYDIDTVYVQKFDLITGECLWGGLGAIVYGGISQCEAPYIVADGEGGVLCVWRDNRHGGGNDYYLWAQHLDSDGNPLWTANGIALPWSAFVCDCVPDGQGNGIFLFAGGSFGQPNVFRLMGDGQIDWWWTVATAYSYLPWQLLRHPADDKIWMCTWENYWPNGNAYVLYQFDLLTGEQFFGPSGVPLGGEDMVATFNGVIIFETEWTHLNTCLEGRRLDSSGNLIWESSVALGGATPSGGPIFSYPECVSDGKGGAVVVFEDRRQTSTTEEDISAQRLLWDGSLAYTKYAPPISQPGIDAELTLRGSTLQYTLPQAGNVELTIFDIMGRRVALIEESHRDAGIYEVNMDKVNLTSGIYLVRMITDFGQQTKKVVVIR